MFIEREESAGECVWWYSEVWVASPFPIPLVVRSIFLFVCFVCSMHSMPWSVRPPQMLAGAIAGGIFRSPRGPRQMVVASALGAALGGALVGLRGLASWA